MSHVAIDFETYYDAKVNIQTMGVYQYLRTAEIYLVAIYDGAGYYVGKPECFDWKMIAGMTWVSHNRAFDSAAFDQLVGEGIIPSDVKPSTWECTADLAVYLRAPRELKGACFYLLDGREVAKNVRKLMKGLQPWEMTEVLIGPKGKLIKCDDVLNYSEPTLWDHVIEYAGEDAKNCWDLWEKWAHAWPSGDHIIVEDGSIEGRMIESLDEQRLSRMTSEQGNRGFLVDQERLLNGIALCRSAKDRAREEMPWAPVIGSDEGILSLPAMQAACRAIGVEPPKTVSEDSEICRQWELDHPEVPFIRFMRQYRKANIMLRRMETIRDRLKPDGRFPFSMMYGGAQTLRWSGGSDEKRGGVGETGFNVQNFPKEPLCFNEDFVLVESGNGAPHSVDLRACVISPPGKKLAIADLAQIEPRIIKWLAGDWDTLSLIESGMSIYEIHARQTMGWTGGNLKKENPRLQFLAKQRVLSLGYGCGPVKFANSCKALGVTLEADEAKSLVDDFKAKEPGIVRLWNMLQHNFKEDHDAWKRGQGDGTHRIELPTGRELVYWFATPKKEAFDKKAEQLEESYQIAKDFGLKRQARAFRADEHLAATRSLGSYRWEWFWGAKLLENVVQAIARDVMANAMLNLEDQGHKIIFHVHDEAVLEVDEGTSPIDIEATMSVRPSWAPNLPIAAECAVARCYMK